ncbi:MAG TPA: efflux RND transporter periplasmic adaptor subunit [Longimicrobiaceae bacterium]|nr:efflux RND transporter periplasmic adaptor subunit [Longimicrobiaceae bacterium]
MKRRSKVVLSALAGAAVVASALAVRAFARDGSEEEGPPAVEVVRGDLVERALATGTIEPEVEVGVKSKVSGVVRAIFVEEGSFVRAGQPLMEIRPDPTPVELVEARRQVELSGIEAANARRDLERADALVSRGLAPAQELDSARKRSDEAALRLRMAREKLQLLERGSTGGPGGSEAVVRSPVDGYVLERLVETGNPVVPLSSYQEGTVLMTMANMDQLIFRGAVDEIDVGKLREGMPVEIKIGALPDARVRGVVRRISLKARKEESATTFPVEIALEETSGATLRAGLSANAEIVIRERKQVLTVPERVVTFAGDTAWVSVQTTAGPQKRVIRTGLSDALRVEVVSGLRQGEKVLEKPTKTIE